MKSYAPEQIRNIGIIAHQSAGKTSLAEAMLFNAGGTNRLGKVTEGNTVFDFLSEEIRRQISTSSAIGFAEWKGNLINMVDTPGYQDFFVDVLNSLRVCEGAYLIVSAVSGVKVQTERVFRLARDEDHIPVIAFVNKMERERANFLKAVGDMETILKVRPLPLQLPMGAEDKFAGVIDLIDMKARFIKRDGSGQAEVKDIPAEFAEEAKAWREKVLEAAAEADDALLEKYLGGGSLTREEVSHGIQHGTRTGSFIPVLCGSALLNMGVREAMDAAVDYLPSGVDMGPLKGSDDKGNPALRKPVKEEKFSAFVFKTFQDTHAGRFNLFYVMSGTLKPDSNVLNSVRGEKERIGSLFLLNGKKQTPVTELVAGQLGAVAKLKATHTGDTLCDESAPFILPKPAYPEPSIAFAIAPKTKGGEDKLGVALGRLLDEDPSYRISRDEQTHESVITGMGQLHIEVAVERLHDRFGVDVEMKEPKIAYRETIKGRSKAQGKHKKQTGGRGQYGDVWLELEPLPKGSTEDFEFVDKVVGGVVPRQFIPAVEKGLREALVRGVIAGYPVTGVRVALFDGSYHDVDSSEMAFKVAASKGFKKGFLDAKPVLLEPIMTVEVVVPDEFMGDVIGNLNSRRGKIIGVEPAPGGQIIRASVPHAEVLKYEPDLRSMTEGRGSFTMHFQELAEVPSYLAEKIIAAAAVGKQEEEE